MMSNQFNKNQYFGYRLQYMEVFNWGTFDQKVFTIHPSGLNSLMTGANASGKSTFIDALLTLLVPIKRDRFYNQSSGVERKGDRTEETYVVGNYGTIQVEGEAGTSSQSLRNKNCFSVLLASFSNPENHDVTLFQVRWFQNGQMKRIFGLAHDALRIEDHFSNFSAKRDWKKEMEMEFNSKVRQKIEFFSGPTAYANRFCTLFGMRSDKALNLFNHLVGVKVLDNLNEFIRVHMLEKAETESRYKELLLSFITLTDAKRNIDKAEKQMDLLYPISELISKREGLMEQRTKLYSQKELAVYWFAQRSLGLAEQEQEQSKKAMEAFRDQQNDKSLLERKLKQEESALQVEIQKDEIGGKVKQIERNIETLEQEKNVRQKKLEHYNEIAQQLSLAKNPDEATFSNCIEEAKKEKQQYDRTQLEAAEERRKLINRLEGMQKHIQEKEIELEATHLNKNNISAHLSDIRDGIVKAVGATRDEIPFVAELLRVKSSEEKWENAIEKLLHGFALQILVPQMYYEEVNRYVNSTNLKGRVVYQLVEEPSKVAFEFSRALNKFRVINKVELREQSRYAGWIGNEILKRYNYACVDNVADLSHFNEKAMTQEGLMKHRQGRHEKDDRANRDSRRYRILGWNNEAKLNHLNSELITDRQEVSLIEKKLKNLSEENRALQIRRDRITELTSLFSRYKIIDWQSSVLKIEELKQSIEKLEASNDQVKELQAELHIIQEKISVVEGEKNDLIRSIFAEETKLRDLQEKIVELNQFLSPIEGIDSEQIGVEYPELLELDLTQINDEQSRFQQKIDKKIDKVQSSTLRVEDSLRIKISEFKRPSEIVLQQFTQWRSDVSVLPEPANLDLVGAYQEYLQRLEEEDLPKFKVRFGTYLQETVTNKIGSFHLFFTNWAESINENINQLNESLKVINFNDLGDEHSYIQIIATQNRREDLIHFKQLMQSAIHSIQPSETTSVEKQLHFEKNVLPLIDALSDERWRGRVMDVRSWFNYKAEEFSREDEGKLRTYENMGQLSGGEKAQLTYTILGSAIAYQFGLTKEDADQTSFRFIAIDEAFKSQDEDKARYLLNLCKQLKLQLLVVTPLDNIQIVENEISYVHFIERREDKTSYLYDMPILEFKDEREKFLALEEPS